MEKRGPITAEDTTLVKRYLIVPMILDVPEAMRQVPKLFFDKSLTQEKAK